MTLFFLILLVFSVSWFAFKKISAQIRRRKKPLLRPGLSLFFSSSETKPAEKPAKIPASTVKTAQPLAPEPTPRPEKPSPEPPPDLPVG